MLLYVKYHAGLVVSVTWALALLVDRSVPYFPIEISRTGAGPYSSHAFKWGVLSLILSLWYEHQIRWPNTLEELVASPLLVWVCLVVVAWFPDNTHLLIHGTGVFCMMACVLLNVFLVGDTQRRLPIVLAAVGIEAARILLKGFVVLFTELDNSLLNPFVYLGALTNYDGTRTAIVKQIMDIMFRGVEHAIVPHLTIPMFRVTGVMQWVSIYLMMCLY